MSRVDPDAQAYIDAIDDANRPLFERLQRLVDELHPEAEIAFSYKMPTYVVGKHRLYVGVWKHGLSFYGLDTAFADRHPELRRHKSTIQLSREAAERIDDDDLRDLLRDALPPNS